MAGRYVRRAAAIIHALKIESACEEFDKDSNSTQDYLDSAEDLLTSVSSIEGPHHVVLSSGMIWLHVYNSICGKIALWTAACFGKSGPITDVKVHLVKTQTQVRANELAVPQRLMPHRQPCSTVNMKYDHSDFYSGDDKDDSGLYNVTLDVNMRFEPRNVPNISLMSKLTGESIVGHPLNVDVLEDGMVIEKRPRGRPCTKNITLQH
ncbi:Hypothetical predicted protein [Olea europaea subsp. europaea]|uniref:Uncharacterized protein n=1 Tax=Olea europaea subsp. europaea TaxID=158383 RepID=A0A8S0V739_OLEEU|nr:Hypothetical predicted protein [Olea europaea subsp. europaea]